MFGRKRKKAIEKIQKRLDHFGDLIAERSAFTDAFLCMLMEERGIIKNSQWSDRGPNDLKKDRYEFLKSISDTEYWIKRPSCDKEEDKKEKK